MITQDQLKEVFSKITDRLKNVQLSDDAYAALGGAAGGAGLGALNWLIRPKDRDQHKAREFFGSVFTGAGLGALAGYGLNKIPGLDIGKRVNYYRHPENVKAKIKSVWEAAKKRLETPPAPAAEAQPETPAVPETPEQPAASEPTLLEQVTPKASPQDPTAKLEPGQFHTTEWVPASQFKTYKNYNQQKAIQQLTTALNRDIPKDMGQPTITRIRGVKNNTFQIEFTVPTRPGKRGYRTYTFDSDLAKELAELVKTPDK